MQYGCAEKNKGRSIRRLTRGWDGDEVCMIIHNRERI